MPPEEPTSLLNMIIPCLKDTDAKADADEVTANSVGPEVNMLRLNTGPDSGPDAAEAIVEVDEADAVGLPSTTLDGLYWGLLHNHMEDLLSHEASMAGQSVGW